MTDQTNDKGQTMTKDLGGYSDDQLQDLLAEAILRSKNAVELADAARTTFRAATNQLKDAERERFVIEAEIAKRIDPNPELPFGDVGTRDTAEARLREIEGWSGHPWYPVLKRLDKDIAKLVPDYSLVQLKTKFGGLRYYVSFPKDVSGDDRAAVDTLIVNAEVECFNYTPQGM